MASNPAFLSLEIIGLVAGAGLGAIPLLEKMFAAQRELTTTVRIYLGSNSNFNASLGGDLPSVALWDNYGQVIGTSINVGQVIPQGNFRDVEVVAHPDVGNIQAAYVSVIHGGNDAVCISAVTITSPDDTKATWSGDIGALCGANWFESQNVMEDGANYIPKCTWIDGDYSNDLRYQGFGIHLPDFFSRQAQIDAYSNNSAILCKSGPRFRMYEKLEAVDPILTFNPILAYNDDGTDVDLSKVINNPGKSADQDMEALKEACGTPALSKNILCSRCRVAVPISGKLGLPCKADPRTPGSPRFGRRGLLPNVSSNTAVTPSTSNPSVAAQQSSWPFHGKLVISNMTSHSAQRLCGSDNSWGPDFVAVHEGKFCSMQNKTLYDTCLTKKASCCFDVLARWLRPCTGQKRGAGDFVAANKTTLYNDIHEWN